MFPKNLPEKPLGLAEHLLELQALGRESFWMSQLARAQILENEVATKLLLLLRVPSFARWAFLY